MGYRNSKQCKTTCAKRPKERAISAFSGIYYFFLSLQELYKNGIAKVVHIDKHESLASSVQALHRVGTVGGFNNEYKVIFSLKDF